MDSSPWPAYNASQRERAVRGLCSRALEVAGPGEGRRAVDLGCGAGIETAALLAANWAVAAIDSSPDTAQLLAPLAERYPDRLDVQVCDIADARFSDAAFIHAAFSLPFVPRDRFDAVWERIRDALVPGGLLACDLFGDRDSWANGGAGTFLTRDDVTACLDGLEIRLFEEVDEDGPAFSGPKRWHRFEVIARRR